VSVRITVRVTPRSGRESIAAGAGGVFSVRVAAAPADGKANAAVCRVVADAFGVPKTSVKVVRGATSRIKTLEVDGVDQADIGRFAV
jgi:uncharacterized protein (TIGR00251 family)